ncbi:aspartate--tRNA(Asn) ligase [Candidatus Saccharibacteria bacterium]|nr:aspartate--tRNA(Asn) ligase [Candidatus Saccharibacteria bacterium]
MRTLTSELAKAVGKSVMIEGWLHKKRLLGGLNFISLRDRGGLVQIVVEQKDEVEKLRSLQIGTVLKIEGKVVKEERAQGGVEIHDPRIEVLVPVTAEPLIEIDKPISHKPEHLDTLFEHRALSLRNLQEQAIFKARSHINQLLREYLTNNDFVEIQTPKLVAGSAEGGAEVFKLDYFGQEATLAQSPQLYKQMMVGVFERVFEIGQAYRAEPSATTRHMSEVTMLDVEVGFIDSYKDVLDLAQDLVRDTLEKLYKEQAELLKKLNSPELKLTREFPRYTVAQVHEMYSKANNENTVGEKDLRPDEERWICEYAKKNDGCEAVFVTDLPKEAMKFYHMENPENDKTALSSDLLFRGVEIATVPQREHRHEKLVEQITAAGIDPKHPGFRHYLSAFEFGLPPHGGFGFGIDRFVQLTLGLKNVKEATLFPRDINRLTP